MRKVMLNSKFVIIVVNISWKGWMKLYLSTLLILISHEHEYNSLCSMYDRKSGE